MEPEPRDTTGWLTLLAVLGSTGTLIQIFTGGSSPALIALAAVSVLALVVFGARRFGTNVWLRLKVAIAFGRLSLSRRLRVCKSHEWATVRRLSEVTLQLLSRDDLDLDLLNEVIDEYGRIRPASKDQIDGALERLPVLERVSAAENRELHRRQLIEDIQANPLLFVRGGRLGGGVRLKFMETNFFVAQGRGKGIRIKPELLVAATEQFGNTSFDSVVFLKRDNTTDGLFDHVEHLKETVKAQQAIGFPSREQGRHDPNWFTKFSDACVSGKKVLIVETWLSDDLIDRAYDDIMNAGGHVVGVLIVFQSADFEPSRLRNADAIRKACPNERLEGQIILRLN